MFFSSALLILTEAVGILDIGGQHLVGKQFVDVVDRADPPGGFIMFSSSRRSTRHSRCRQLIADCARSVGETVPSALKVKAS